MVEWVEDSEGACQVADCDRPAAVRLDVPWAGERVVCLPHGRTWSQREGVVATALSAAADELSQGHAEDDGTDGA